MAKGTKGKDIYIGGNGNGTITGNGVVGNTTSNAGKGIVNNGKVTKVKEPSGLADAKLPYGVNYVRGGGSNAGFNIYDYGTWNDAVNQYLKTADSNKGYYTAYDKNGQLHYSTTLGGLDNMVQKGNNGGGTYTYKGMTYSLVDDGNGGYTTKQKGLADIDNAYADLDAMTDEITEKNRGLTNSQYDSSAKQAYIQYLQNQKALKDQISRNGYTGGASESSYLKAMNNYGTNVANNESSRNMALSQLDIANMESKRDTAKAKASDIIAYAQEMRGRQADLDAEKRNQDFQREQTAQQQKYETEKLKLQSQLSKGELKYQEQLETEKENKAKTDAKKSLETVNKKIKEYKKSGKTYYTWTTTDKYGNTVYHVSTNRTKAGAASGGEAVSSKSGRTINQIVNANDTKNSYIWAKKYK